MFWYFTFSICYFSFFRKNALRMWSCTHKLTFGNFQSLTCAITALYKLGQIKHGFQFHVSRSARDASTYTSSWEDRHSVCPSIRCFVTPSISLSSGTYFSVKQVTRACNVAADRGGVAVTEMRVFLLHARDSITRSVRRSLLAFFRHLWASFALLLLPKCLFDNCPCQPGRDLVAVFMAFLFFKSIDIDRKTNNRTTKEKTKLL